MLRIILMFMVCVLHTLGQGGVLAASTAGTTEYSIFWLLEIFSYCAVDGFALISGYTAKNGEQKYAKIVDMWFQAFFYAFIVTAVLWMIGIGEFETRTIIKAAMPVTFGAFWYFTAYFALFFAMPVLNRFLFSVDEADAKKSLILLVVLYSGLGVLRDPFNSREGYSALWLMVLYCIGVLSKRIGLFDKRKGYTLVFVWGLCVFVTWADRMFWTDGLLTSYVSPTVLLSALIMVTLFSRLKLRGIVIRKIAPLTFGIYLFQLNTVLWNEVLKGAATPIVGMNLVAGVACVFLMSAGIFASGLIAELIRAKLASVIGLPKLSKKIADLTDSLLEKAFIFLN